MHTTALNSVGSSVTNTNKVSLYYLDYQAKDFLTSLESKKYPTVNRAFMIFRGFGLGLKNTFVMKEIKKIKNICK